LDDISYIKLSVQSTENIKKVEELMNEFIVNTMIEVFNNINETEFKQIKKSIYDNLIDKDTNLYEISSHYINEIIIQEYMFDRKKEIANKIKDISLNDIKQLYHSIIKTKTVIKII
jgi:secreted Zn-dependent insulinase-like peptidase